MGTCAQGKCEKLADVFAHCVLCGCAVGCALCCVFWAVLHLQGVLGLRGQLSACLGSHWTAGLGSRRQGQPGKKSALGLHRLSVGTFVGRTGGGGGEDLGKGHGKRKFLSTRHQKQVIAGPEGICQITLPSPSFYRRGNCVSERSRTDPRPHSHQNSPFLTTICHNDLPQLYCNVLCEPVHTAHTRCIHKQHMQCWCAHG